MKKPINFVLAGMLAVPILALSACLFAPVAQKVSASNATNAISNGANNAIATGQTTTDINDVFLTITNSLLFLIGAVSVVMLVYGGFRYTTSGGDSSAITAAKNTILYAVVGIVVAIAAYAIVNFVIIQFTGSGTTPAPAPAAGG
jgi:hypothetical protein